MASPLLTSSSRTAAAPPTASRRSARAPPAAELATLTGPPPSCISRAEVDSAQRGCHVAVPSAQSMVYVRRRTCSVPGLGSRVGVKIRN
eukprot:scaffold138722_cov69-Phaeocystis_antarctica.AAC.3